jgi:hypothetical protein
LCAGLIFSPEGLSRNQVPSVDNIVLKYLYFLLKQLSVQTAEAEKWVQRRVFVKKISAYTNLFSKKNFLSIIAGSISSTKETGEREERE